MTIEQVAEKLGSNTRQLRNAIKKYPSIENAFSEELQDLRYNVENVLLNMALGGDIKAIELWLRGNYQARYVATEKTNAERDKLKAETERIKAERNFILQNTEMKKIETEVKRKQKELLDDPDSNISAFFDNLTERLKNLDDLTEL